MREVTVIVNVGDGETEEYRAFLVHPQFVMYLAERDELFILKVQVTENPNVYRQSGGHVTLFRGESWKGERQLVERVVQKLKDITLFQFVTEMNDMIETHEFEIFTSEE